MCCGEKLNEAADELSDIDEITQVEVVQAAKIAGSDTIAPRTVYKHSRRADACAGPYGPLSKNLVMLAAIYLLYTLEARRWNTSS